MIVRHGTLVTWKISLWSFLPLNVYRKYNFYRSEAIKTHVWSLIFEIVFLELTFWTSLIRKEKKKEGEENRYPTENFQYATELLHSLRLLRDYDEWRTGSRLRCLIALRIVQDVCLSVCSSRSATRWYCVKTAKLSLKFFHRLVGLCIREGRDVHLRYSVNNSLYLGDGAW